MDKPYVKGEFLEIFTYCQDKYEGYFHSKNNEGTRLSLYNVVQFPKGDLLDLYHFTMSDIKQIKRVEMNQEYENIVNMSLYEKCDDKSKLPNGSSKFIFINQMDNRYHEAVSDLLSCESIAVGTDGAEMGRKCKLSLLTLSTFKNVYIFDIQVIQENMFKDGIRNILENDNITKIIHNSRKLSDCLYHKHNVELKNVFDTQVADILIQNRKVGSYPKDVRKLIDCLNIYLGCGNYEITEKIDIVELANRPVLTLVKESVANNVIFLHALHKALLEEIMKPFIKGFNFYINCQRQCSDSEAWYLCGQDKRVPKDFPETLQNI